MSAFAQRGAFDCLNASLYRDGNRRRPFMVMTAYFDESGTHGADSAFTVVAGFIATIDQWSGYELELSRLMRAFNVNVYHAKDWRQRKGSFKTWPMRRRAEFNSRFLRLADDALGYGLAMILPNARYATVYKSYPFPKKARPDSQYGLTFRCALLKSLIVVRNDPDRWPINIVLEDGHKNASNALRVYGEVKDQMMPEHKDVFGSITFMSKKSCLPLTASDSLAYEFSG